MYNMQPLRSESYAEDLAAMAYITPQSFPVRKKGASPQRRKVETPVEARSEGFQRDAALFHGADTQKQGSDARFAGATPKSTGKAGETAEYAQAREQFYAVTPAEAAQRQTSRSLDKARKQFYGDS